MPLTSNSALPCLVSTDLDGTLLDHHSYSYAAAMPAMQRLAEAGIPLLINTSKTWAEVASLREELGNPWPAIVENGSCIVFPEATWPLPELEIHRDGGYGFVGLGMDYSAILECLQALSARYDFRGFASMSDEELAEHAALPLSNARLARQRRFSEPLLWLDSEAKRADFIDELAKQGLSVLQGGRYLHVMADTDKGRALERAKQLMGMDTVLTVALGDSANDIAMLEAADIAVVVRPADPHKTPLAAKGRQQTLITELPGPLGWNACMQDLLDTVLLRAID